MRWSRGHWRFRGWNGHPVVRILPIVLKCLSEFPQIFLGHNVDCRPGAEIVVGGLWKILEGIERIAARKPKVAHVIEPESDSATELLWGRAALYPSVLENPITLRSPGEHTID